VASQKSKRRSRKRSKPGSVPRAAPSARREQRVERTTTQTRQQRQADRQLGTVGERPPSPFGGVPVSEIAIFAGLVALLVWLIAGAGLPVLVVGMTVTTLGVLEITGREHLSGYRSHTTLLAAIPALALGIGVVSLVGTTKQNRAPFLIAIVVPVYAFLFWQLRKRFMAARQARVARPPAP
jgi:hypothetical protein